MSILKFFGFAKKEAAPGASNDLAARISAHLATIPAERAEMVAAYAGLLIRVAHADVHICDDERAALPRLIAEHTTVSAPEAETIATIALEAKDMGELDYALLTRAVNAAANTDEKLDLIDCLYAVATADGRISVAEDEEIRAVSRALLLTHKQFIVRRSRYKEKLAVIQSLREVRE